MLMSDHSLDLGCPVQAGLQMAHGAHYKAKGLCYLCRHSPVMAEIDMMQLSSHTTK